jgi:hypothetical protein
VQLLHTLKIRSSDSKQTLLSVIKNPVTRYLPANTKKYGAATWKQHLSWRMRLTVHLEAASLVAHEAHRRACYCSVYSAQR